MAATTPEAMLEAVRARLVNQIAGLTDATCFLAFSPEPTFGNPGDPYLTVSGLVDFDDEYYAGGGEQTPVATLSVLVAIKSPMQLDEAKHAAQFLAHANRGFGKYAKAVFKAICTPAANFNPTGLVDQPWPVRLEYSYDEQKRLGQCVVAVGIKFEYDFTS